MTEEEAPKPRKPRGPSTKVKALLGAEYMRGYEDGRETASPLGGLLIIGLCTSVVGFVLGYLL
jgi:hypothetical protein